MDRAINIGVVIPTYQRRESVRRLLVSLTVQTIPPTRYEVIVSIDGSDDGTREMVDAFIAPYALRGIWMQNRGRAIARNEGIRASVADVILCLDDDMEATPELLAAHLRLHPPGSRVGVIGAAPVKVLPSSPPITAYIGTKFNQHLNRLCEPNHEVKIRDFYSGNFSIRRDVLYVVGLFDESFRRYGNEDLELAARLVHGGVQLKYSVEALAYQYFIKDFAGLARDTIAKGHTAVQLATLHPETYGDSKLATYESEWRKWRPVRSVLLAAARRWPGVTNRIVDTIRLLERRRVPKLNQWYALALDYCYWLGVHTAFRENQQRGHEPSSLRYFAMTDTGGTSRNSTQRHELPQ